MEIISGLTNAGLTQTETSIKRQEAQSESFRSALEKAVADQDETELKKACTEFEAYFIQTMFKEMRKTVHSEDGIFPKGQAETMFQELLDEENAKSAAKAGGIGLAEMMYRQMSPNLNRMSRR